MNPQPSCGACFMMYPEDDSRHVCGRRPKGEDYGDPHGLPSPHQCGNWPARWWETGERAYLLLDVFVVDDAGLATVLVQRDSQDGLTRMLVPRERVLHPAFVPRGPIPIPGEQRPASEGRRIEGWASYIYKHDSDDQEWAFRSGFHMTGAVRATLILAASPSTPVDREDTK